MTTIDTGAPRLAGRKVLVVGAGTQFSDEPDPPMGNGRAIAVAAAKAGAMVACADVDKAAAEETARMIVDGGGTAVVVEGDVSDADQCQTIVDCSRELLAGLDGLVLNVGIGLGKGWMEGTTAEQWDKVFSVNVRSHFLLCRAAIGHMEAGSSIVFVSSVAGLRPGSRLPSYDSSKAAIIGLCRHVALEGGRRNVRANVVAPGLIDTPLGRNASRGRPFARHNARPARPAGNRGGDRRARRVSLEQRGELHHRPDHRRRRRPHPHLGRAGTDSAVPAWQGAWKNLSGPDGTARTGVRTPLSM